MALMDLKTDGSAETVKIDDEEYTLQDFDDFTPLDQHALARQGRRITSLFDKEILKEPETQELEALANSIFNRIAGTIPDLVRQKLKPGAKQRIVNAYFLAYRGATVPGEETKAK